MKQINTLKTILIVSSLSIFLTGCKKDIDVPKQELNNLFGTWEWVQSSGGFAGITTSPLTEGHTIKLEFNENGIYKEFKNGEKIDKRKFSFIEGKSIYTADNSTLIEYEKTGVLNRKENFTSQSIIFFSNDTLQLNDECYDCFSRLYVKK